MTSLKNLRNRARSIESTLQMTQAMKLISSSRYNKLHQQIKTANNYSIQLLEVLRRVCHVDQHKLLEENFVYKNGENGVLLVIMGSDKGLCSTFNINIIKTLEHQLTYYRKQNIPCKMVCYGNKISQYIEKHYKTLLEKGYPIVSDKNVYNEVYPASFKLANDLFHLLKISKFSACDFIYTKYVSNLKVNTISERVLPIDMAKIVATGQIEFYTFDNLLQDTLYRTVANLFVAYFHKFYINSITAEHSSRMMAMDNATNNASSLLTDLKMEYNRKRQDHITKELIEIISGSETIS